MDTCGDNLERLIRIVGKQGSSMLAVSIGTVTETDEGKRTCRIQLNDDITLFNCRLNAIIDEYDNRILIVPKKDSKVAFVCIDANMTETMVIAYSEIEKVLLTIGESDMVFEDGSITFNGGDNKGLINIQDLTDKLNKLVDEVNALKDTFNSHTHSCNLTVATTGSATAQSGTATGTSAAPSSTAQAASKFNKSDYEDEKITH